MGGACAATALAQTPADLNPAVNTSVAQPPSTAAPAAASPRAAAPHAEAAQPAAAPAATTGRPAAGDQLADTQAAASPAAAGSSDRIELGTTEISGNRELPKLMYIVPWQRAAVGKVTGRPPNSLVDEALTPVDRGVFERQNSYYAALQAASASAASQPAAPGAAPAPAAPRDEK
jgi:hypothetical protein